jgi:predicted TPR repeat methyltransferase
VGDLAQQLLPLTRQNKKDEDDSMQNNEHYSYQAVLDAGCGTGLTGRRLRPLIAAADDDGGVLIGVDASRKMLDIAASCTLSTGCGLPSSDNNNKDQEEHDDNRPLYDKLLQMDLQDMTIDNTLETIVVDQKSRSDDTSSFGGGGGGGVMNNTNNTGFDLVVAADVLVYFGNLNGILGTFASVSRHGGMLIFSTERLTTNDTDDTNDKNEAPVAAAAASPLALDGGWRLQPSGRFAHSKHYAVDVATRHGYKLVAYQEIVPRLEKGAPVHGQLLAFVLGKNPPAHSDADADADNDSDKEGDDDMHSGEL